MCVIFRFGRVCPSSYLIYQKRLRIYFPKLPVDELVDELARVTVVDETLRVGVSSICVFLKA